ncbi:hypothetical protein N7G274_008384 [Stereocaulon virgatum]|uniref:Uncharacterized protein n=1 Tax=Stereocaulon virgatum TaxID=373712 RepID=A0ABR3ZYT5_9LECA
MESRLLANLMTSLLAQQIGIQVRPRTDTMAIKVKVTLFRVISKASRTPGLRIRLNTPITPVTTPITTTQTIVKAAVPATLLIAIQRTILIMTLTPIKTTTLPTMPTIITVQTPITDLTTVIGNIHGGEAFSMASAVYTTP